jgi:transcriptional regulator with XRE-family HTH domain
MIRFDSAALYAALDKKRKECSLSWKEVAMQAGVSPSTISNTRKGSRMEVDGMLALVYWIGVPVESFVKETKT